MLLETLVLALIIQEDKVMMELVIWQGKKSEALSRILELNNKALNVHCFNHRFNLAIAKSCNIQKLQNLMVIIKEIYFINLSRHREQCLKDAKNYLM